MKYGRRINEGVKPLWREKRMGERLEAIWSLPQKNRTISERLWERKYRKLQVQVSHPEAESRSS